MARGGRPAGRPPQSLELWTLPLREVAPLWDATYVVGTCYLTTARLVRAQSLFLSRSRNPSGVVGSSPTGEKRACSFWESRRRLVRRIRGATMSTLTLRRTCYRLGGDFTHSEAGAWMLSLLCPSECTSLIGRPCWATTFSYCLYNQTAGAILCDSSAIPQTVPLAP